jgi:hypothetical protein
MNVHVMILIQEYDEKQGFANRSSLFVRSLHNSIMSIDESAIEVKIIIFGGEGDVRPEIMTNNNVTEQVFCLQ